MQIEPSKNFVGVIDFFSIMLPGGILSHFLYGAFGSNFFGPVFPPIKNDTDGWVILIFAAYLFGHFVFLIGSILDETIYYPIRRLIWRGSRDQAQLAATIIKKKHIRDGADGEKINTFQWAKAILVLNHPAGMAEVARFEADSKFFRSLVIVLAILSVVVFSRGQSAIGWVFVIFLLLSLARYVERRFKGNQHAFWYMITLDSIAKRK